MREKNNKISLLQANPTIEIEGSSQQVRFINKARDIHHLKLSFD